jgi:hypothetical protein
MVYILAYPFAALYEDVALPLVVVGGLTGGVAAGFIWSAQGSYFAKSAQFYADLAHIPRERASAILSGRFSGFYLGLELIVKVIASVLLDAGVANAEVVVFFLFGIIAICGTLLMTCITDFGRGGSSTRASLGELPAESEPLLESVKKKALVTSQILFYDNKMQLMLLLNAAFGFNASFNSFYVGGVLVRDSIGANNVGYLTAISSASAAILALFMPTLTNLIGYPKTMALGVASWLIYLAMIVSVTDDIGTFGTWGWLVLIFILIGVGRGVWEAVVKAVFADFFAYNSTAGFAALHVQSAASSAVGYFVYPEVGKYFQILICMLIAVFGLRDYILANRIDQEEKRNQPRPKPIRRARCVFALNSTDLPRRRQHARTCMHLEHHGPVCRLGQVHYHTIVELSDAFGNLPSLGLCILFCLLCLQSYG